MAAFSEDFLRFLYANYPDDFRRASAGEVSDGVVNAMMLKHDYHYQVWKSIPEWIKNRYGDRIPSEVLNGNETAQDFVLKETNKKEEVIQSAEEAVDFSVTLLALGYTANTVSTLMENRDLRESLLRDANGGEFTEEQWRQWLESRGKDLLAIEEDWRENQPEKYLMHVVKALSREKLRSERAKEGADKAASEMKITALERELRSVMKRLDSREQKICMVNYLKQQPQQAALRHLHSDVRDKFIGQMQKKGIQIEPVNAAMKKNRMLGFGSLTKRLREDFNRMTKHEGILKDAFARGKKGFQRPLATSVLDTKNNGGFVRAKKTRQEKVRA